MRQLAMAVVITMAVGGLLVLASVIWGGAQ